MNMSPAQGTSGPEKNFFDKRLFIVLMILLVSVAGMIVYVIWPFAAPEVKDIARQDFFPGIGDAVEGHLPNMAEDKIREQMQREADRNVFSFKINSRPVFKDGDSEGTLRIENPGHNIYPFVVKIFLKETGKQVYDSGGVLPNHHINKAKLSGGLPKGEHAATAYIHAYDPETNEYSGKSAVELTLIVAD